MLQFSVLFGVGLLLYYIELYAPIAFIREVIESSSSFFFMLDLNGDLEFLFELYNLENTSSACLRDLDLDDFFTFAPKLTLCTELMLSKKCSFLSTKVTLVFLGFNF